MWDFEKLKVKKTQAPKKLNVFSAQKLKLPEVFSQFFQNSRFKIPKNSRKCFVFALKRLKNTIYWYRKANFAPKLRILPKFCPKLKDFNKNSTVFSKNLKTQAISPKNSRKSAQKLKVPEVSITPTHGKTAQKKAWSIRHERILLVMN